MAVVRVKRRLTEEPVEALLLACKRVRKVSSSEDKQMLDDVQSIFTFAGTVGNKKDIASPHIAKVFKQEQAKQTNPKFRAVDIIGRSRKAHQNSIKNNRFKLINSHRELLAANELELEKPDEKDDKKIADIDVPVYDVIDENDGDEDVKNSPLLKEYQESELCCNGVVLIRQDVPPEDVEKSSQYVYDLYYTPSFNDDGLILEHSFSIETCMDPKYAEYRNDLSDEYPSDDDDSNDENYYKNDYPDEDSEFETDNGFWRDYDEGNVTEWLSTCGISKSVSSDDEDDFIQSESQPSQADIYRHGEQYARYKARVLKEFKELDQQMGSKQNELLDDSLSSM